MSISENGVPIGQLNNLKNVLSGTVTKVTGQSVCVAVDNDIENLDDQTNENEVYKIIKLCNEVTHKRIKNALVRLKEEKINARTSHLADVLFLRVKPDTCNINHLNINTELTMDENGDEAFKGFKFFNKNLDKSQKDAVKLTFEQKDLAIIHGPPGTGKTTTLIEIIKQNCLKYKQKILCCAPSKNRSFVI